MVINNKVVFVPIPKNASWSVEDTCIEYGFDLKYPIRMPADNLYATLCVYSFTCPISFYIINDTNNMLAISVNNGNVQNLFIPNGNYNVNTFISALLTILPAGFYVTLNNITNKLTLTHSTYDFVITAQSTIGPIMGFGNNESISSHLKTKLSLKF